MSSHRFFYEEDHLPPGLFKACIIPRPIGWVSSIDQEGRENLAPFSYFNAVCDQPPMVMFATLFCALPARVDKRRFGLRQVSKKIMRIWQLFRVYGDQPMANC